MTVQLFVFDAAADVVAAVAGRDAPWKADAVVVDWERSNKVERQRHAVELHPEAQLFFARGSGSILKAILFDKPARLL